MNSERWTLHKSDAESKALHNAKSCCDKWGETDCISVEVVEAAAYDALAAKLAEVEQENDDLRGAFADQHNEDAEHTRAYIAALDKATRERDDALNSRDACIVEYGRHQAKADAAIDKATRERDELHAALVKAHGDLQVRGTTGYHNWDHTFATGGKK